MGTDDFSQAPLADGCSNSPEEFLRRAADAARLGDGELAIHLYLAAFERDLDGDSVPGQATLEGLRKAWELSLSCRQRSLAEYIFEKLEPYWTDEEANLHAEELQRLAFDKLEEIGFPQEMFDGIAGMMGAPYSTQDSYKDISEVVTRRAEERGGQVVKQEEEPPAEDTLAQTREAVKQAIQEGISEADQPMDPVLSQALDQMIGQFAANAQGQTSKGDTSTPSQPVVHVQKIVIPSPDQAVPAKQVNWFDFSALKGFGSSIQRLRQLGVGHTNDAKYKTFVAMLNRRHGVSGAPALGTLMFSSPAREDANCLMAATVGELRIPAVRMRFDRSASGQAALVVMTSPDFKGRVTNIPRNGFEGPAALILEDLDCWIVPEFEVNSDEMNLGTLMQMQVSRGAHDAMGIIQAALEHPDVSVLVSAAKVGDIDPFFLDLIGPFRDIEIPLPGQAERKELWRGAQAEHPSLRGLDVTQMVRYSRTMSRYEIWAIANEAVDIAYRRSLAEGRFCAVSTEDVLMRLASFQPLDSEEYHGMEDQVVAAFSASLDQDLDSLLDGDTWK